MDLPVFIIGKKNQEVNTGVLNVRIAWVFLIMLVSVMPLASDVGEGELSGYKSMFLKMIISANPGREQEIRRCLDGLIRDNRSGVKLLDKFGLFLYDSRKNGLSLEKVKYLHDGHLYIFMIILKDTADGGVYNLYLEYTYDPGRGSYKLSDICFSMVFGEKIKSVSEFFGGG